MQLDSGTLSPLVRRLEQAGLVAKTRSPQDERVVTVQLTSAGQALRGDLAKIPAQIAQLSGIRDDAHRRRLIAELHELTALLQSGVSTPATGATALRAGE